MPSKNVEISDILPWHGKFSFIVKKNNNLVFNLGNKLNEDPSNSFLFNQEYTDLWILNKDPGGMVLNFVKKQEKICKKNYFQYK